MVPVKTVAVTVVETPASTISAQPSPSESVSIWFGFPSPSVSLLHTGFGALLGTYDTSVLK